MHMFSQQQEALVQQMDQAFKDSPMDFWMKMTQKNLDNLQKMQRQFFSSEDNDQEKPR